MLDEAPSTKMQVEYYGADFPVQVLVWRMEAEEFIIPGFQREYVWKTSEASRFIESLLLGLPTPALFLAKDKYSQCYLVIDGQQRLRTLQYFYEGVFPDGTPFRLRDVAPELCGRSYADLPPRDRRVLDNAIIHCIIISEDYDPTGIFYIFERLNTTGTPLTAQEIRNAIYHGPFSDLLKDLCNTPEWHAIYGERDPRAYDQELVLRFFATHFDANNFHGTAVEFLNQFMLKNKDLEFIPATKMEDVFRRTTSFLRDCIGARVFRRRKAFNRALFDVMMLTAAKHGPDQQDCGRFRTFHATLVEDGTFWEIVAHRTSDWRNLLERLEYSQYLYERVH